ncbi:MAG TPA: malonate transporter [Pasteurellaceae bacterium]|nr:malonate transporter [Pasteurellaceae bacterium]
MNNSDFLSSFLFSLNVTLPTILMLLLGIFLGKRRIINDSFCEQATKLIFNVTLPLLLFMNIFTGSIDYSSQVSLLIVAFLGSFLLFLFAEIFATKFVTEKRERCTFVQGVFRGNNGILGLAFCINAYGEAAFAPASIYSAALVFIYNILGVITITRSLSTEKINFIKMTINILKNPLIIGISLGVLANLAALKIPQPLLSTGHYLANITLPLALICTGATINMKSLQNTSNVSLWASIGRLVIAPIFMVLLAKAFGIDGMHMGIVLLMTATPLAAATYAMVRSMGGNAVTVANIIGITTIGSMFASSLGIIILSQLGWI